MDSHNVFATLIAPLQRVLSEEGYTEPTPIQHQSIPHLINRRDLLGCAQTGTGKTAAFALPIIQHLCELRNRPKPLHPRALILSPTRELAAQIHTSLETYARHTRIRSAVVFGGVGQYPQVRAMQRGVDILVATPGRLMDLMNQGYIHLGHVRHFVLDEADRMLEMGFIPDIRRIVPHLPKERQSLFFSATMPAIIAGLAKDLLVDPVEITIDPGTPTVERINQSVLFVDRSNKDALLAERLNSHQMDKVLIFTRTKHGADKVVARLYKSGVNAAAIHGNKSQSARTAALNGFRVGRTRALVATDIAARGLDVDGITHVINYDLPEEPETYIHRIGRTGRAGRDGSAASFCSAEERSMLTGIEKCIRLSIPVVQDHSYHSETASNATNGSRKSGPRGRKTPFRQRGRGPAHAKAGFRPRRNSFRHR